ncbi:MAG: N-acetylmuramoyl-L-alanine amidase [Ignavibacteriales bacterium]|nr:N-acetylmuramoyl-L-alanine amidase [Ignavibacteriales bacterium]
MNFKAILLIFFCSLISVFAQKSSVELSISGDAYLFPSVNKKGIDFISVKNLSEALSAPSLFNPAVKKMEIRFPDYIIKFTARNQFVILTSEADNKQQSYQMPVAALLSADDILIPIQYSTTFLSIACGKEIKIAKQSVGDAIAENKNEKVEEEKKEDKTESTEIEKPSYNVSGISLNVKTNGTLVRIKSNKKIGKFSQSIIDGVLFLNIIGINLDEEKINSTEPSGLVKKIAAKNTQNNSQIEFELGEGYSVSEAIRVEKSNDLLITIHNKLFSNPTAEKNKERWKFDAVVIDAGHGGKDPGAIGLNGVEEKKINLAIALKLGELIEHHLNEVKVIYTRSSDKFIELYKRGKIANEKNGKLFISIHCNSTPQKPTHISGFEVYLLRPGRTREAIDIAQMENSVIKYEDNPKRYQELTDENFILVTMAHSSFMKYSEKFSDILNKDFSEKVNLPSNGIKQAGFYVLVGASMPSVLIESGYLSNKKDETYLNSKSGQEEIAESIFNSVKKFKEEYDNEMKAVN